MRNFCMKEIHECILLVEFCWGRERLEVITLKWTRAQTYKKNPQHFLSLPACISFIKSIRFPEKALKQNYFSYSSLYKVKMWIIIIPMLSLHHDFAAFFNNIYYSQENTATVFCVSVLFTKYRIKSF